jgi:hypothetical protein
MSLVLTILFCALGVVVSLVVLAGIMVWFDVLDDRSKGALGRGVRGVALGVGADWIESRTSDGDNEAQGNPDDNSRGGPR